MVHPPVYIHLYIANLPYSYRLLSISVAIGFQSRYTNRSMCSLLPIHGMWLTINVSADCVCRMLRSIAKSIRFIAGGWHRTVSDYVFFWHIFTLLLPIVVWLNWKQIVNQFCDENNLFDVYVWMCTYVLFDYYPINAYSLWKWKHVVHNRMNAHKRASLSAITYFWVFKCWPRSRNEWGTFAFIPFISTKCHSFISIIL